MSRLSKSESKFAEKFIDLDNSRIFSYVCDLLYEVNVAYKKERYLVKDEKLRLLYGFVKGLWYAEAIPFDTFNDYFDLIVNLEFELPSFIEEEFEEFLE